jgi:hypothetical protein
MVFFRSRSIAFIIARHPWLLASMVCLNTLHNHCILRVARRMG